MPRGVLWLTLGFALARVQRLRQFSDDAAIVERLDPETDENDLNAERDRLREGSLAVHHRKCLPTPPSGSRFMRGHETHIPKGQPSRSRSIRKRLTIASTRGGLHEHC